MRIYKENGKVIVELTGYDVLFTDNSVQDTVRLEDASGDIVLKINTINEDGIITGVTYGLDRKEYVAVNKAMQRAIQKIRLKSSKSAIVVDKHMEDGIRIDKGKVSYEDTRSVSFHDDDA